METNRLLKKDLQNTLFNFLTSIEVTKNNIAKYKKKHRTLEKLLFVSKSYSTNAMKRIWFCLQDL